MAQDASISVRVCIRVRVTVRARARARVRARGSDLLRQLERERRAMCELTWEI